MMCSRNTIGRRGAKTIKSCASAAAATRSIAPLASGFDAGGASSAPALPTGSSTTNRNTRSRIVRLLFTIGSTAHLPA